MKCPVCSIELKSEHTHKIDGVEVPLYECDKCGGSFFSKKDIEKLVSDIKKKVKKVAKKKDIKIVDE